MMTNEKQKIIRNSVSYKLVHAIALWMDRRLLDPLIGLVLPGFGDALTSVLAVPYLYLCIVIIRNSVSYKLVHAIALWMDRRLLDPLIGLVLPGFGDALTSVFAVPYLYLRIVKLKSIPLTLTIVCNILLDVLIGIIPYIGVVGDVFKRAFTRTAALIKGSVEGDKAT